MGGVAWAHLWIKEAFEHVLFLGVLAGICILWYPNSHNARFAYTPLGLYIYI